MSSIVTDELLCKYIVDSGTLTPQQLEVVRSYLCTNADEADMVAGISMSLYEGDVEDNTDSLNHACAIVPFSDEEIEQRRESGRIRMLELLDDIVAETALSEIVHADGLPIAMVVQNVLEIVVGKVVVYMKHCLSLFFGLFACCMCCVSLLPQELCSAKEQTGTHFPTHYVCPLVAKDWKISI